MAHEQQSSSQSGSNRPDNWLDLLKVYAQEAKPTCLNLSDMELTFPEVSVILEFLANSEVKELNISQNTLETHMKSLSLLLIKTKIERLNVGRCLLHQDDTLSLMKVLKQTQVKDLDISEADEFDSPDDVRMFASFLAESHLTALNVAFCGFLTSDEELLSLIHALRNTSLTHLNLERKFRGEELDPDTILSLFFELKHTSVTHLNLASFKVGKCDLKRLGNSLRDSSLVELNLRLNEILDDQVDDLFQALIGSKVTSLNLALNYINGDNNLSLLLKETQIINLDLSENEIFIPKMFSFPDFLSGSSVESLKLEGCESPDSIGVPLMNSLKFSKLTDLDVSRNKFTVITSAAFADVVKNTSITTVNFSDEEHKIKHDEPQSVAKFLRKLTDSSVTSLSLAYLSLGGRGIEIISPVLPNTPLTHLNLGYNQIGESVSSLAAVLKFTAITHLNLVGNNLNDEGAKTLAECLKETNIVDLDLSRNNIKCDGATALAFFLKDTFVFNLKLTKNKIGNEGLKTLAEHIKPTFITSLEVSENCGNAFLVESIIWTNRRRVQQLVSFFKRIAGDQAVQFGDLPGVTDIDSFLEECLNFYKVVTEQPSVASILAWEESITLSRDEITSFLLTSFPQQFTSFIARSIEVDVRGHVNFLRKVEELALDKIVELLLMNREVYTIDEAHRILHPYVYQLLVKYKLPVCNLEIEPQGIERIIKYFKSHTDLEGAADVVNMLQTKRPL